MDAETKKQITMLCESIRNMSDALNRLMGMAGMTDLEKATDADRTDEERASQEVPECIPPIGDLGVWEGWKECRIEAIGKRTVDLKAHIRINNMPGCKVLHEVETEDMDIPEFDDVKVVIIGIEDRRYWMKGYIGNDGVTIYEI